MKVPFNIVVAVDAKNGIGKDGALPWRLPGDLKMFREITTANSEGKTNIVIMGRKTWESIPDKYRPLCERYNIILTRNREYPVPVGVYAANSLEAAMALISNSAWSDKAGEVFVIGGQEIFEQAIILPGCHRLYVTHILECFDCEAFFPDISAEFEEIQRSDKLVENGVAFYFSEYLRKASSRRSS